MTIPFKPSLLAMASVLALSACISGGGDAPAVKSSETPSNKVAPPPPLIRETLLQVLIRQAPRQALMAERKMMRPNIMIMRRQAAHPTRSLKTTVICPSVMQEGRMAAIKIPMRRKMRNLKMVRKETL
ncbi:putative lipoprotein [Neisseria meningitidis]|nr:putative lipoprotein [Neisseria meningitidis]